MGQYEPVDVWVKAAETGEALAGVVIRIFDPAGVRLFGSVETDQDGHAGLLLYSQQYSMRFYRFATAFVQPLLFTVLTNDATPGATPNTFDVMAQTRLPSMPVDARLCRASGFVRDIHGAPRANLSVIFSNLFSPLVLDGSFVVDGEHRYQSDPQGWLSIDLIRGAIYTVVVEGLEDRSRTIRVPDLPTVNIANLLFPVVRRVVGPLLPVQVQAQHTTNITVEVLDSVGVPLVGSARQDVWWRSDDPAIANVDANELDLTISGVSPGTTYIRAFRRDKSIIEIPAQEILGLPITVSVTAL